MTDPNKQHTSEWKSAQALKHMYYVHVHVHLYMRRYYNCIYHISGFPKTELCGLVSVSIGVKGQRVMDISGTALLYCVGRAI